MILADTSVWIDHIRGRTSVLVSLLEQELVLSHPFVVGEIMLGGVQPDVVARLKRLPSAIAAADYEAWDFIGRHRLAGRGVGYVDVHLLVSTQLTPETRLLTQDKKLQSVAEDLNLFARLTH